tara:strand:- start:5889 stop:6659 length:771 start_codon:yes stop_codon:yes gene_type:complete
MKHNIKIILILISLFVIAQLIGLYVANQTLPYGVERPKLNEETSFLPIFIMILILSLFIYLLSKFKLVLVWKIWFFIAVILTLYISFSAFIPALLAFLLGIALAIYKVFKPNIIVHNFTEVFIYGALASLFFQAFSILSISILLILISIYDVIAVWKTKHMVKLAKFQAEAKIFAGLMVPYKKGVGLLGGGDIGLPLLFTAIAMKEFGYYSLIITLTITISLALLFFLAKKKKFYPAMPPLTIGCFVGYFILKLLF